jgi:hypothetical protein
MQKAFLSMLCLSLLVFTMAGVAQGWQGRMGGMGDPYGLVADESDFLIHPAKIATGEGVKFYGSYRFTYTGVTDWGYNLDRFTPTGVLTHSYSYDTTGEEYRHNALVGAVFPLGPGRMGLFFPYDGIRGNYEGNEEWWFWLGAYYAYYDYNLTKFLDNYALGLLYGLPIGGSFNLGGEVQFAYRNEENKNLMPGYINYILGTASTSRNLTPFQLPYDSSYWEALFKGSLEGVVGPLDLEFTLRGGFIFAGDNSLMLAEGTGFFDADGDVTGWRIGGDMWARFSLMDGLTLPFLVRVDYDEKSRDGEGPGQGTFSPPLRYYPYESQERNLHLEAGGGVDKELGKGARIAAGIYYNYLQGQYAIMFSQINGTWPRFDHSDYPASIEHQVMIRLTGELELSPAATLHMGLVSFYGWVRQDFRFSYRAPASNYTDDISLNGYHWGIGASLGGTVKIKPFTVELFINGGWQQINMDGDGDLTNSTGLILDLTRMDKSRSEWSIGGGLSILFGL